MEPAADTTRIAEKRAPSVNGSVPGPHGNRWYAAPHAYMADRVGYLENLAQRYGDVCRFRMGIFEIFLLSHPDHVRALFVGHSRAVRKSIVIRLGRLILGNGLLSSEGDFHRRQRRLIAPAFHRKRIEDYCNTMAEEVARLESGWTPDAEVDMHLEMTRLTLAIIGKTMFGADVDGDVETVTKSLEDIFAMITRINNPVAGVVKSVLPLPSNLRFLRARARLDRIVYRMIRARRNAGDTGDLLGMLLEARDAEGDGSGMTDKQVRDEALVLFLAGHETTANALTWTFYLLSRHPEAAERLHAELDAALGGRAPRLEDFERLHYLRMVAEESMRLYPPAYAIDRELLEPLEVGGYTIPAGKTCFVSPWVLHHDPRFYPDPYAFNPERWTPEEKAKRPKYAYLPFGAGPRICIGEQFAWTETIATLAILCQRWRPELVPGHPVEAQPLITLRPRYGMRMRLVPR